MGEQDTEREEETQAPAPAPEPEIEIERPEDIVLTPEDFEPAELSAEEVDPEEARKDESSSMAHDKYDNEGNRVN